MALSYVDHTVTDASDLTYLFTGEYIDQDHIRVFISEAGKTTGFVETTDFTLSGTETNLTVTLTGSWASGGLELGDIVRIRRITPDSALVDFQPGTLTSASLDLANKQIRFLVIEAREFPGVDVVIDPGIGGEVIQTGYEGDQNRWDCGAKRLSNVADGVVAEDATTVSQVLAYVAAALGGGSGTVIDPGTDNQMLYSLSGEWAYGEPATIRSVLGLGDAATRTVGAASASNLPARSDADARYLQISEALREIQLAGTEASARGFLGLGTAAVLDTGTSDGDVVAMTTGDELPAVKGTHIDLSGNSAVIGNVSFFGFSGWWQREDLLGNLEPNLGEIGDERYWRAEFSAGDAYNGSITVNGDTGDTTQHTLEFSDGPTAAYEVSYSFSMSGSGTVNHLSLDTTSVLSGASGWTTRAFLGYSLRTGTFVMLGTGLLRLSILYSIIGGGALDLGSNSWVRIRRLA